MSQYLFGMKILLALALFTIALLLTIPVQPSENLRAKTPKLLLVNLVLGITILLLAAIRHGIP